MSEVPVFYCEVLDNMELHVLVRGAAQEYGAVLLCCFWPKIIGGRVYVRGVGV